MDFTGLIDQLNPVPLWLIIVLVVLGALNLWRMVAVSRSPRRWADRAYYRGIFKRIPPNEHLLTYHGRR